MSRSPWLLLALLAPAVAQAGYQVSTFRKETKLGANFWNIGSLIDGKFDSCWQSDPEADNVGQWIEIDVPKGDVDKVAMVIGWDKDEETFLDYARVKKAKVEVFDMAGGAQKKVHEQVVSFEDKRGWQVMDLTDAKVGDQFTGGRVRITVSETYEGKDYPALAVSEALVHMKEFDVPGLKLKTAPEASEAGKVPENLVDGSAKTVWASAAPGPVSFELEVGSYGVSSIGVAAGPKTHGRPKNVEFEIEGNVTKAELADKPEMQWVQLPAVVGYTGSLWADITVRVVDVYPGGDGKGVGITDVKVRATNLDDL